MKNSETKNSDTFQKQFEKFHMLLIGSKMAKHSTIILMLFSLILIFFSEKSILIITALLIGFTVLGVYILKFLQLGNINQKPNSKGTLSSSISKFKTYLDNRKKFEILYLSIWTLSLIPFLASYFGSSVKAIIAAVLFIVTFSILGLLGFKKAGKDVQALEAQIQN